MDAMPPMLRLVDQLVGLLAGAGRLTTQSGGSGLDALIDRAFAPFAKALSDVIFFSVPTPGGDLQLIVAWLVLGAVYCTIRFRFINVRGFVEALRLVSGRRSDPNHPGEVSHFQALATAVSGTVGVGNIAHVAIAITVGGPGAAFWLIVAGVLGMSSKFVECTLGVRYRYFDEAGVVLGGPMVYLREGLAERGLPRLGRVLASYYAVCILVGCLGIGCMFQANQAYVQFVTITGGEDGWLAGRGWAFGFVLAVLVGLVIVGGIRSIARVTDKLVPAMATIYLIAAWVVIAAYWREIPGAIGAIVSGAFTPEGVTGGWLAVMLLGFRRAAFSNEAGIGSASIAHAAVRTTHPATEGLVALLEPFIDTVIVCGTTALVITVSGYGLVGGNEEGLTGVQLTSAAFESVIGWFPYLLAVVVILFAFSTMISWAYYGLQGWLYLVGRSRARANAFNLVFCLAVAVGCAVQLQAVIDFSDAMVFAMALANILGLYLLAPQVQESLDEYFAFLRSSGNSGSGSAKG